MTGLVIDCSAIMGLCFEDEYTDYHDKLLEQTRSVGVWVPAIWTSEVGNVLNVGERRHRIKEADSIQFVKLLSSLQVSIADTPLEQVIHTLAVAREHRLTFYDAEYLALALANGYALATLDANLERAAKTAGVSVFC